MKRASHSQSKKLIFISYISEEKELAIEVKKLIESSFLGMIEVFVSSTDDSIQLGQNWLDSITSALKTCLLEIILCSHNSIKRPWVNFEAGAGWVRDIPVIPLCHSGLTLNDLPLPLSLLQAARVDEVDGLRSLFKIISKVLESEIPTIDFEAFILIIKELEAKISQNKAIVKLSNSAEVTPFSAYSHKCTNCNQNFPVKSKPLEYEMALATHAMSAFMSGGKQMFIECPKCGNTDEFNPRRMFL